MAFVMKENKQTLLETVNNKDILAIFISDCALGVVFTFFINQCCSNFEDFVSAFNFLEWPKNILGMM